MTQICRPEHQLLHSLLNIESVLIVRVPTARPSRLLTDKVKLTKVPDYDYLRCRGSVFVYPPQQLRLGIISWESFIERFQTSDGRER